MDLKEVTKRNEAASAMVTALNLPKGDHRSREWRMSIPARPGVDPDLVIAASLEDVAKLVLEVEALRKFKAYVHGRLDAAGIDSHDEQNSINGCRIGSRLDDVLGRVSEADKLRAELQYQSGIWERASEDFGDFQEDMAERCRAAANGEWDHPKLKSHRPVVTPSEQALIIGLDQAKQPDNLRTIVSLTCPHGHTFRCGLRPEENMGRCPTCGVSVPVVWLEQLPERDGSAKGAGPDGSGWWCDDCGASGAGIPIEPHVCPGPRASACGVTDPDTRMALDQLAVAASQQLSELKAHSLTGPAPESAPRTTWYHGTSEVAWAAIQAEGVLWGVRGAPSRCTYLADERGEAERYGDVVLEVSYVPGTGTDNYEPDGWQVRVYTPIPLAQVRRIDGAVPPDGTQDTITGKQFLDLLGVPEDVQAQMAKAQASGGEVSSGPQG